MSFIAEEVVFLPLCPGLARLNELPLMYELMAAMNQKLTMGSTPQGVVITIPAITTAVKQANLASYTTPQEGKQALEQKIKPAAAAHLQSLFPNNTVVTIHSPAAAYVPSTTSNRHEIVGRIRVTRGDDPTSSLVLSGMVYNGVPHDVEVLIRLAVRWID